MNAMDIYSSGFNCTFYGTKDTESPEQANFVPSLQCVRSDEEISSGAIFFLAAW